ncbi:hypothetical protein NIES22_45800 [Calothrix brevissima NIES-22]|nr:hypothetical protein NIES22_45800 [Calothrix brevissima NIES-22]
MSNKKKQCNSQFEINDLIDDAVNNALARRSEALIITLSDEEANSISGGTSINTIVHGVIIKPPLVPTPCHPYPPFPKVHGVVVKPPIIQGVVINPYPQPTPLPPIIHGVVINPNPPEA